MNPAEILQIIIGFYRLLYNIKLLDRTTRERILESLKESIIPGEARLLIKLISTYKIKEAIYRAVLEKSSGINKLPIKFYKALIGPK
jgi:hypothetical protein